MEIVYLLPPPPTGSKRERQEYKNRISETGKRGSTTIIVPKGVGRETGLRESYLQE